MITQIEIDGFKTFKDFKVELAPFQVIVGPNGSGKSNLFDALQLLSRLAEFDLLTAFQGLRGDTDEMFTKYPDGRTSDKIKIAVEMLVDSKVQDDLGRKAELKYTRLRYEVVVSNDVDEYGLERLYVIYESLVSIPEQIDAWSKRFNGSSPRKDLSISATFISTVTDFLSINGMPQHSAGIPLITLHRDDQIQGNPTQFRAKDLQRTLLSTVMLSGDPHAFAVQQELRSLRFVHLNPELLRKASSVKAPRLLSRDGANLPTVLAHIQAEDHVAFLLISLSMANLVPDIIDIRVERNVANNEWGIWATTSDKRNFSAQLLSDGTLRLLALVTIKNDPQTRGVICIEEPEDGVQPLYLERLAKLLREIATDFDDPEQKDGPLRQVIVTTHSPLFVSQPEAINSLLLASMPIRTQGKNAPSFHVTRMDSVLTPELLSHMELDEERETSMEAYTIDILRKYLDSDVLDEAQEQLEEARKNLHKR